jgi:RecJ-like exonuclease
MTKFVPKSTEVEVVTKCRACDGTGQSNGETCQICDGEGVVPYLAPRSIFAMSPEERKAIMEANPPEVTCIHGANAYFDWSWMGCGHGQLSFSVDSFGHITCMDEHMGRDRVRTLLHALADHIADNAVLDGDEV